MLDSDSGCKSELSDDITYFYLNDKFYYLVFIIDVYTREVVGYNMSFDMRHESNIKALEMALKQIHPKDRVNMIHHSDCGSQYRSKPYMKMLKDSGIKVSMEQKAQDNAYAERINGTIKNEYLKLLNILNYKNLKAKAKKAVTHYNNVRKHNSLLNGVSPKEFKKITKVSELKNNLIYN